MKPFNLEEAKARKPVCTRDGRDVTILTFDAKREQCICGLIHNHAKEEDELNSWNMLGEYSYQKKFETEADLFMKPEKKDGYHFASDNFHNRYNSEYVITYQDWCKYFRKVNTTHDVDNNVLDLSAYELKAHNDGGPYICRECVLSNGETESGEFCKKYDNYPKIRQFCIGGILKLKSNTSKEPKFKIGDKVKVTGNSHNHGFMNGEIVTIKSINNNITFFSYNLQDSGYIICENDLELYQESINTKKVHDEEIKVGDSVFIWNNKRHSKEIGPTTELIVTSIHDDILWFYLKDNVNKKGTCLLKDVKLFTGANLHAYHLAYNYLPTPILKQPEFKWDNPGTNSQIINIQLTKDMITPDSILFPKFDIEKEKINFTKKLIYVTKAPCILNRKETKNSY